MASLIDVEKIGKIFHHAPEFINPDLHHYIKSSLPVFKSHYGYRKVSENFEENRFQFKMLSSEIPVFTIIDFNNGGMIVIDLNYIDKLGVAHKGNINIDVRALYESMLCGSILKQLQNTMWFTSGKMTSLGTRTFYPVISDIITSIFMKLFAKKYGILSDDTKISEFQSATAVFIARYIFQIQTLSEAKAINPTIESNSDLVGNIFSVRPEDLTYDYYIDSIAKNILFGIKPREFKNSLFTRMGPRMIPAFESPKYAIALFGLLAFNSGILNINHIKSWNKSAFDKLDKLIERYVF